MHTISRRRFFHISVIAAASTVVLPRRALAHDCPTTLSDDESDLEKQFGDPALPPEPMPFDPLKVQQMIWGTTRASFESRIPTFSQDLIAQAATYEGMNRVNNRQQISHFLELFELPFHDNGTPLAFCAAGLSYAASMVYVRRSGITSPSLANLRNTLGDIDHHHFYPSPSVMDMKHVAMGKRRWLARTVARRKGLIPQPGWLVIYNWNQDGKSDHVGMIESATAAELNTIEFNTSSTSAGNQSNGGAVARRRRPYNETVEGFIQPELRRIV